MKCPTNIQPIYIKSPIGINLASLYNAPPDWFEIINGDTYLKILVNPEEYVSIREGEGPKIIGSFASPRYPLKLRTVGFVVTMQEDNVKLRYLLEEIIVQSLGVVAFDPVRVIDFVKPNREDFKSAIASSTNPYTVRDGFLEIDPGSGQSGNNAGSRLGINGLRFTFRQIDLALN